MMYSTVTRNSPHRKAPFWLSSGPQASPTSTSQLAASRFISEIVANSAAFVSVLPTRNAFPVAVFSLFFLTTSAWTALKAFTNRQKRVSAWHAQFNARAVPLLTDKLDAIPATQTSLPVSTPLSLPWDAGPTFRRQLKQSSKTLRTVLGCLLKQLEVLSLSVGIILLLAELLSVSQAPHSKEISPTCPHTPQSTSILRCFSLTKPWETSTGI